MIDADTIDKLMVVAPLLLVVAGGLGMMLADAFVKGAHSELSLVSSVVLFAAAATALGLWLGGTEGVQSQLLGNYIASDRIAYFLDAVICGGAAIASLLAGGYLREHGLERGEYYVVLVFSVFGAMVLSRAVDLLSVFLGLETMSLGVYGLVAFRRHSPRAAEGALKYFLLGSFASAILLFGMSLLYGATGHTNLVRIGAAVSEISAGTAEGGQATLLILAMFLILAGFAFKVSAVPFHAWTPDAYEGAVTPATTFMAVVVKAAVFAAILRVFFIALGDDALANEGSGWPPVMAGLAAITMVVGNFAAIVQKSVKRMLAYSSIAHAGYLLMGVVATWKLEGEAGLSAVLYYLAAYTVSNLLAFGSLILLGSRGKESVSYDDLAGVGRRHPLAALPMALGVLSLMGFPPTAGFFGKYYVIIASVEAGGGMIWLAVLAVLTSAVGAYYYLRVIVVMFMKQPEQGAPVAVPMRSGYVVAGILLAAYFVLRMGIAPESYLALVGAVSSEELPGPWTFAIDAGVAFLLAAVGAALAGREPSALGTEREEPARTA
jgi:NADH-quinone oxidoreductase subunit N